MNRVILIGRLTRDVEEKVSGSGTQMARFTVAVDRRQKKDAQGPTADFISCVAFGKTAENMARYLQKGSRVGVEGRIQTGSYEKDGKKVYTTDVFADNVEFLNQRGSIPTEDETGALMYGEPVRKEEIPF